MEHHAERAGGHDEVAFADEQLRKVFEYSNDAGFVLDPANDRVVDANRRACTLLGYTYDELLATPISAIHPQEMPQLLRFTGGVLEQGSGWTDELTCATKSHTKIPAEISAAAVEIDGEARVIAWVRDVGDRKRAEAALRESEERFRLLVEHAADSFYLLEEDGRIVDVNQRVCEDTGYSRQEVLGMHISEISEGTDAKTFERHVGQMQASGPITVGSFHRRKDGTRFPVEVRSRLFQLRGRRCVLSLARDVTERVKAEEQRRQLALERGYLLEELEMERNFGEIVGTAPGMRKLFRDIERVAGTDSTVLITGETGTGKELVARAIHRASGRKEKVLVKVNCAALSAGLIESELFGHEKGAFTGAIARRVGRFELASGGTIFLDEIGDLSAEVQAKLLRVLQEAEFERVGGMETLKVDVRVIAATNRDLERAVERGEFRADLFYRLNVFPLRVPPLRERSEDIPLLVSFLLRRYGAKLGKQFQAIAEEALQALTRYSWPGNVRELENVIERAAIVSQGDHLDLSEWLTQPAAATRSRGALTLDEVQRLHIIEVLEHTGWRVSGPNGAARILGMEPSTLTSRMSKLGIKRPR